MDPLGAPSRSDAVLAYVNSRFETGIPSPLDAGDPRGTAIATSAPTRRSTRCRSTSSGDGCRSWSSRGRGRDRCSSPRERRRRPGVCRRRRGAGAALDRSTRRRARRAWRLHDTECADGLRVLAVAYVDVAPTRPYSRGRRERDLVLVGFLSVRRSAARGRGDDLAQLERDGVASRS